MTAFASNMPYKAILLVVLERQSVPIGPQHARATIARTHWCGNDYVIDSSRKTWMIHAAGISIHREMACTVRREPQ